MAKTRPKIKTLDNKLWKLFSEYTRRKGANYLGEVSCYTCYAVKHWKEVDAGHFVSRNCKVLKFDEQNVKPQCKACNGFQGGMSYQFGLNLDQEYGEGTAENLEAQRFSIMKRTPQDYEELIEEYQEKLANL